MKIKKSEAYKKYQSLHETKAGLGEKMNAKRKEIESLLNEKKQLEKESVEAGSKTAQLLAWRKKKKSANELDTEIDQLTEELQQYHDKAEDLNNDIEHYKTEMFKAYVSHCEGLQKDLYKKIDEAHAISDELKTLESDHWEPLRLAGTKNCSPYIARLERVSGWIEQHKKDWERMKEIKINHS